MKTVLILRHGKSSWKNATLADHDRPLKKRGKRDGPKIGRLLVEEELVPDLIMCSSAKRALRTAELVADHSRFEGEIRVSRDLYHAGTETYIQALRQAPGEFSFVMLVGHNPGLEDLVEELAGEYVRMPTAALVQISLPVSGWAEIDLDVAGRVENVWLPREL